MSEGEVGYEHLPAKQEPIEATTEAPQPQKVPEPDTQGIKETDERETEAQTKHVNEILQQIKQPPLESLPPPALPAAPKVPSIEMIPPKPNIVVRFFQWILSFLHLRPKPPV